MSEQVKSAINATIDNIRVAYAFPIPSVEVVLSNPSDEALDLASKALAYEPDPLFKRYGERLVLQLKSFPIEAREQIIERALSGHYV